MHPSKSALVQTGAFIRCYVFKHLVLLHTSRPPGHLHMHIEMENGIRVSKSPVSVCRRQTQRGENPGSRVAQVPSTGPAVCHVLTAIMAPSARRTACVCAESMMALGQQECGMREQAGNLGPKSASIPRLWTLGTPCSGSAA